MIEGVRYPLMASNLSNIWIKNSVSSILNIVSQFVPKNTSNRNILYLPEIITWSCYISVICS